MMSFILVVDCYSAPGHSLSVAEVVAGTHAFVAYAVAHPSRLDHCLLAAEVIVAYGVVD